MAEMDLMLPEGLHQEIAEANHGKFVFVPLERGYGVTVGNALRRVLLSSMPGASIVAARFDGVAHEFSTISGVKEELPEVVLNLKQVRLRFDDTETDRAFVYLRAEGKTDVKASDLDVPASLTLLTPDIPIATLTSKKSRLYAELVVVKGRGYVPADDLPKAGYPAGTVFLDGIFSPVTKVNFRVENVRVKARTDYEKLILDVWTDGTMEPKDAILNAANFLRESIDRLSVEAQEPFGKRTTKFEERERTRLFLLKTLDFLEPSKRTANCLRDAGIETIADLVSRTEEGMLEIKNFGEKSLAEIKEKLSKFNLEFGMEISEYLQDEGF
jgi:DNA-directed RNA polymerase subunit alpha